jgi:hypothetical protein
MILSLNLPTFAGVCADAADRQFRQDCCCTKAASQHSTDSTPPHDHHGDQGDSGGDERQCHCIAGCCCRLSATPAVISTISTNDAFIANILPAVLSQASTPTIDPIFHPPRAP